MNMPEKNSEVWLIVLAWCQQHFNTIYTFLLSVMIAIFRICYHLIQILIEGVKYQFGDFFSGGGKLLNAMLPAVNPIKA